MTKSQFLPHPAVLLALAASLAPVLPAQTPANEVVVLSPFEVRADSIKGYGASETMTGSRIKTQIIDLPYTVNVLTSEFFSDFGIFELSDNITHVSSFSDGFFRLGRYGSSNIDRMEIIKGSNAAIYGRTSPGGMINMISKQPRSNAAQVISYNYGDYGTQRVTVESTGPLLGGSLGKTNYVLTASHYQREFGQPYARNRNQEYYLAIDHVFADGSKLFLSGEHFFQLRHAALAAIPLITDQRGTTATTDDVAVGYATNLGKFNPSGPNQELNRGNTSFTAVYDKRLNSIFSARVSGNYYGARRWDYNFNVGWGAIAINRPAGAASTTQRGATPNQGRIYEDGGGFQADLLAQYYSHDRKIEHRTLVTLDINDYYRWDPQLSYAPATDPDIVAWNAVRTITLDANLDPVGTIAYFPKWYYESPGRVPTRNTKRRTTVIGGLLRHQSALFDGRLLAYAGARFDSVRYRHHDALTAASSFTAFIPGYTVNSLIERKFTEVKPNFGFNYKVTPNFRFFANYSESYFVNQGDTPLEIADPKYKTEVADGIDIGFKGALLDERLNFTVSYFDINRENVSVSDIEESPAGSGNFVQVTRRDGDQKVKGFEVDVNWLVTDEWSLLASYGAVNSKYTDFGSAFPAAVGRRVQFIPFYNGSVSLKYAPVRGKLKGFSANLGITFVGETPTEAPNAGDTYATTPGTGARVVTSSTGQWALRGPAYSLWSAGLRYTTQGGSKYDHTFALNVNNIADKQYLRVGSSNATRLRGEERAIYFTYTLRHKGGAF
jgi:outer membrane receptor protein involved in Fe transport